MPGALMVLAFPVFAVTVLLVLISPMASGARGRALVRCAAWTWVVQFVVGVWLTLIGSGDYTHQFWGSYFPMIALAGTAGAVLVTTFADDRAALSGPAVVPSPWVPFRSGAFVAAFALGVLGTLPILLIGRGDLNPAPREFGWPLPALVEAFAYGYGGDVPATMVPVRDGAEPGELRSPPRWVGVPMATTWFAAAALTTLSCIVLLGRCIRPGGVRRVWLTTAPLAALAVAYPVVQFGGYEEWMWRNDPRWVRSYGPVVTAGIVSVGLVVVVVLRDGQRTVRAVRDSDPHRVLASEVVDRPDAEPPKPIER